MPRSNPLTRVLVWAAVLLCLVGTARAEDPATEEVGAVQSAFKALDDLFAEWFVGPVYSVLFYDVWLFDDTLTGEAVTVPVYDAPKLDARLQELEAEGVEDPYGTLVARQLALLAEAREAADADPNDEVERPPALRVRRAIDVDATTATFAVERSAWLDELRPIVDTPVERTIGGVRFQLVAPDGDVHATAIGGRVDLAALGIDLGPAALVTDDPDAEALIEVVHPETGIRLRTDSQGVVRSGEGPVDSALLPIVAGMTVIEGGERALVLATDPGGVAWIRSLDTTTVPLPVDNPRQLSIPFVVAWLVFGAVFFTFRMGFVNLRMFGHALAVTAGRYDHPDDEGEISHFQALSSALSATVGLGNIAGVAIAVGTGGPGAVFWMVVAGFLGMSSKFVECTLGQMFRTVRPDGTVSGGPMHYLSRGVSEVVDGWTGGRGLGAALGYPLGALFALMCIGGSFGGGNMFQANQSFAAIAGLAADLAPALGTGSARFAMSVVYGLLLAGAVGLVILGGIKRIGKAAGLIVPLMCGIYLLAGVGVLLVNAAAVPDAFVHIVTEAFTPRAGLGGVMGVLIVGFQRAAFSNEAGIGSASIAHSAATTNEPIREGIVALLEPFVDTILVCTMTGLVVVVTGAYQSDVGDGVLMTSHAFSTVFSWFPYVLTLAVVLFAFSTMISWSYYGERCTVWLLGEWARTPYKLVFLVFVVFGAVFKLGSVLDFSDLMVLGMAVPNIVGLILLSGKVKGALDTYRGRLRRGEFKRI